MSLFRRREYRPWADSWNPAPCQPDHPPAPKLPVLPRAPQTQDVDDVFAQFVAQFVLTKDDPPHVARLELGQPESDSRVVAKRSCSFGERLHDSRRGPRVAFSQEGMQSGQVAERLARPPYALGGIGFGCSVERLCAQASTSAWSTVRPASTSVSASSVSL